jgi:3-hydroxyisobutyrate dehydrogenase
MAGMSEDTSSRNPIGLVGVGLMGMAYAHRLRGAGLPVVGFDVDPARLEALAAIGGDKAASVAEVVRRCATILVVVFSAEQADGVLSEIAVSAARPRTVVLSITCDPERAVALSQRAATAGLRFIEAPVSGTSDQVLHGDGVGLLGGDVPDDAALTAMFDALMPRRFHVAKWATGPRRSSRSISFLISTAWHWPRVWCSPSAWGSTRRRSSMSRAAPPPIPR